MSRNNLESWNRSDNRKFSLKVIEIYRLKMKAKSTKILVVFFNNLSQTLQRLNCLGAKIIEIKEENSEVKNLQSRKLIVKQTVHTRTKKNLKLKFASQRHHSFHCRKYKTYILR